MTIGSAMCRSDERPYLNVTVKLSSIAPLDAASSVPWYVTGRYAFGVAPGRVRTNVYVYSPKGSQPYSVLVDGKEHAFVTAPLNGQPMTGIVVELGPQESQTVTFRFLAAEGTPTRTTVDTTPMSSPVIVRQGRPLSCATAGY